MDLFNMMSNIRNTSIEEEIKKTINSVKNTYSNLDIERTCMLYSSIVHENLSKKHIPSRIISTKDLGINYEHRFIIVKNDNKAENYFLIDLTYNQFFNKVPDEFLELSKNGYQIINNEKFKDYIITITGVLITENVDNLYFKQI